MNKGRKLIPASVSVIALPLIYVIILVVISYVAISTGMSKIGEQKKNLAKSKKTESVLRDKEQTLLEASSVITPYVDYSVQALPDRNSSLVLISQVKTLGLKKEVELMDLAVSGFSEADKGISSAGMTMGIKGDTDKAVDFIRSTKVIAPIIVLDMIEMDFSGDTISADLKTQSFWKPLPQELGKISEPINKLTETEIAILEEIAQLEAPSFYDVSPSGPYTRGNPFSL